MISFLILSIICYLPTKEAFCSSSEVQEAYFFWGKGCPHCEREKAFLVRLEQRYPHLKVSSFEVWYDAGNAKFFAELASAYGKKLEGVPVLFIGDYEPIVGYLNDEITGRTIEEKVKACIESSCPNPVSRLRPPAEEKKAVAPKPVETKPEVAELRKEETKPARKESERNSEEPQPEKKSPGGETVVVPPKSHVGGGQTGLGPEERVLIPVLGEIDTSRVSLPVLTLVIAGMDAFNPCAFFVLFVLLGLLVYTHSRKIMLLVGGIFVFLSGMVYFIFMAAWLNLFLVLGHVKAITSVAAVIALVIAVINIKDFFAFKKGVSLMIPDKAKLKLYERMRGLLKGGRVLPLVIGTIALAIAANSYELLCTAGFPMVYTRVLTLHGLAGSEYYLYLAFYNLIYMAPLAVIVLLFAVTLGARKFTEWQGQVLKLISGLMMLCLGLVLLLKPELLNNIVVSVGILVVVLCVAGVIVFVVKRLAGYGPVD